jgi:hypothetical protein
MSGTAPLTLRIVERWADAGLGPAMPMFIRRTDPTRCHNCGERVAPYAAGCSLCGAALDPLRWRRPQSARDRVAECWRALLRRER